MKNILYALLFVFSISALTAQEQKDYKRFYKNFKKEQSVFNISAPIKFASWFIDSEEKELKKVIRKGKKVKLLIFSEDNSSLYEDINNHLSSDMYKKYLTITEENSKIKMLVRENKESISEIIVLIKDSHSLVSIGVYGKFEYEDLNELYTTMHNRSLSNSK